MQLFIQRAYARDCNVNINGVIHPETICAAAECPTFPLQRKEYTSIEKNQRQAPVSLRLRLRLWRFEYPDFKLNETKYKEF